MSQSFNYEAEPFQGFTEFDEMESSDEFDEFGEPEFGDFESYETDFEFEPEEERGRMPRAAGGRRPPARAGGSARAGARRAPGRGGLGRSQRPGMRQARAGRGPGGMRRPGTRPGARPGMRGPGGMRARGGMRRSGMRPGGPRPGGLRPGGMRRPGMPPPGAIPPGQRRRWRRYPYFYPYPGYVSRPIELPPDAYPAVGRFGNWLRSGNDVILLLDEDASPLDQAAAGAAPEGAAAPGAPESAGGPPPEGGGDTPPEGAGEPPPEGGADGGASGSEGELWGRGGLSRRKLKKIQHALNYILGLRLPSNGVSNVQTRSALRSYQQQKGLVPHGQADHETETELAYDIAETMTYETEFGGGGSCFQRCKDAVDACNATNPDPQCFFDFVECISKCEDLGCPPRPTLRRGSKGNAVRELQGRLNARGASPRLNVDGDFGPKTDAAVRRFQSSRGLVVDGIVGPRTWAALGC